MEKEKKEKKSNWLLVTILIVALLASFAFGGLAVGLIKSPKGETNTTANKNENETVETKETTSTTEFAALDFDKCINSDGFNYTSTTGGDLSSLGIKIEVHEKTVEIRYFPKSIKENYGSALNHYGITIPDVPYIKLEKTFDKKVTEVYLASNGQGLGEEIIFYLMEDGTVQYTPVFKDMTSDNWKDSDDNKKLNSYGTISTVEGVVGLSEAIASPKNSETGNHNTTLARKADGSFYDLRVAVNVMENNK